MIASEAANATTPTFGEKLIQKLVSTLPKAEYHAIYQPLLVDGNGVGWRPDFVIVAARQGVVVVEVKDWHTIDEIDSERVLVHTQAGETLHLPNPAQQARHYAEVLADRLKQRTELLAVYRERERLAFPWQYALALPNLSRQTLQRIEAAGIWEKGTSLGRENLHTPAAFQQALQQLPWRFKLEAPIPVDMLDTIRGIIQPSLVIRDAQEHDLGTESREQTTLIEAPLRPIQLRLDPAEEPALAPQVSLIRGVAGSGKTHVLVRRAQYLHDHYPEASILVICFNRDLADDLKRRINRPDAIAVTSFHETCAAITGPITTTNSETWLQNHAKEMLKAHDLTPRQAHEAFKWRKDLNLLTDQVGKSGPRSGRSAALSPAQEAVIDSLFTAYVADQQTRREAGEAWADWEDRPILAVEALADPQHPLHQAYDVILIDEAQDFAPFWFRVILSLLKPGGHLFICDDPTQSLFRRYSWKQKGIDVVGHTRILRVPFRSTRQITAAAYALVQSDPHLSQDDEVTEPLLQGYTLTSGPRPALHRFEDSATERQFIEAEIARLLQAGAVQPADIGILCPEKWLVKDWKHLQRQGVYVSNFERMKGLEFQVVFLPHLHKLTTQLNDARLTPTEQCRRLFTAMTRARHTLTLTTCGPLPTFCEALSTVVDDL